MELCENISYKYFKKINSPIIDIARLANFVKNIPSENWDSATNQICFTHTNFAPPNLGKQEGCGSLTYNWTKQPFKQSNEIEKRKIVFKENDFLSFNSYYLGTPVHDLYIKLKSEFKLGRVRAIKLAPKKCMSWHKDSTHRLHIPVITDEGCKMIIENEVFHLPANGSIYLCNTKKYHTAINASHLCNRIHIVVSLLKDYPL